MNIEYRFLQKAISDKNYISFFYRNKRYDNVKAHILDKLILSTNNGTFDFNEIKKIKILKERF